MRDLDLPDYSSGRMPAQPRRNRPVPMTTQEQCDALRELSRLFREIDHAVLNCDDEAARRLWWDVWRLARECFDRLGGEVRSEAEAPK